MTGPFIKENRFEVDFDPNANLIVADQIGCFATEPIPATSVPKGSLQN
jgi:hypothetical protein